MILAKNVFLKNVLNNKEDNSYIGERIITCDACDIEVNDIAGANGIIVISNRTEKEHELKFREAIIWNQFAIIMPPFGRVLSIRTLICVL